MQRHSRLNRTETVSTVCTFGLEIWVERSDDWEFLIDDFSRSKVLIRNENLSWGLPWARWSEFNGNIRPFWREEIIIGFNAIFHLDEGEIETRICNKYIRTRVAMVVRRVEVVIEGRRRIICRLSYRRTNLRPSLDSE